MLRICLLGKPRIAVNDAPYPFSARPKVVPLLAYLLLHPRSVLSRETVANALWPDSPAAEARSNLRRHLNYLQKLLPGLGEAASPWLLVSATTVGWNNNAAYSLDVEEFEQSLRDGRRSDAAALYAGDLLEDADEEFLDVERERLRAAYVGCLVELVGEYRARRQFSAAIGCAQTLLAREPYREDVLRQLMVARYESGDRGAALADYERFATKLKHDLGVAPMPETSAVFEALAKNLEPPGALSSAASRLSSGQQPARREQQTMPFVGRDLEFAKLREAWLRATSGQGDFVLIAGEAGIGKTRLVHELAALVWSQGGLVLESGATFAGGSPYEPLLMLLRSTLHLARDLALEPIWLAVLATVLPEFANTMALPELPVVYQQQERIRLFEAFAMYFEALSKRRPVYLVMEDGHSAGAATIALLQYLARRLRHARLLFVTTHREEELTATHPLRELRRSLAHEGVGEHLALVRLDEASIDSLVRMTTAGDASQLSLFSDRLYRKSEGNPLFVTEMVYALVDSGVLVRAGNRWNLREVPERMPDPLLTSIDQRLARLSEAARTIVETAAVVGRAFDIELVKEVCGWPEGAVLTGLDELMDRRLVQERGSGSASDYAFSHQLIQSAVYQDLDEVVRARRHRRIAHVMEQLYAQTPRVVAVEIAAHWERGQQSERAAIAYMQAAQRASSLYANEEALAAISKVLALSANAELRFQVLLLAETTAALLGNREQQEQYLGLLHEIAARGAGNDKAREVLARRAAFANIVGDREREVVLIDELRAQARGTQGNRWRIAALEAEARMRRSTGDYEGARGAFAELETLTGAPGDHRAHWSAHLAIADTYIYQGRLAEARAMLDELRKTLDPDSNRSALIRTLMGFARASLAQQDYAAMSEFAEAALAASRAAADREGEALSLHTIANGLVYLFHVTEARNAYERAATIYEQIGHRVGIASVLVDVGLFHTELGLLEEALDYYARAADVAAAINFAWVLCVLEINRGYCLRLCGDHAGSKSAAEVALTRAQALGAVHLESAALGTLASAERELGELEPAIAHFSRGIELRRPAGATPRLGDNLCGLAATYLLAGLLPEARAAADEMLHLYTANPKLPPQPTEWLATAAWVYRALGKHDEAARLLQQASSVMQARADAIDDDATRAAFLSLPFNRTVSEGRTVSAT